MFHLFIFMGEENLSVEFTFGMGFLRRVCLDCRRLFDMFHSYLSHFDFVNHLNVNLITLAVLDCWERHEEPGDLFLQPPN